ncbi:hypothetical protein [Streptomyces sp. XY006]|uniref:hypothetical protein n=1 Tax=Streptomyces sp. XY006 TaxID=2021410 RepID=UPI000B8C4B46|nr:hypothetical protein [Streptomyces sp. XY006]OXS33609.1 hypothetical protein CHR28_20140 [Streptomyces sp. XY006]
MEQRIGSSSQPLEGAGFDPAFIPGLTSPASARTEEDGPEKEPEVAEAEEAAPEPEEQDTASSSSEPEEEDAAGDGPVFEASDRRARIVADHRGVRLCLDDQECEFRWDEIGAVETETARFGKRYTVTVHTPDRRWYPIEIEAPARSRFAEWDARLDAVLDAYFEEDKDEKEENGEKAEVAD